MTPAKNVWHTSRELLLTSSQCLISSVCNLRMGKPPEKGLLWGFWDFDATLLVYFFWNTSPFIDFCITTLWLTSLIKATCASVCRCNQQGASTSGISSFNQSTAAEQNYALRCCVVWSLGGGAFFWVNEYGCLLCFCKECFWEGKTMCGWSWALW